jgi:sulfite exporter TauE/SafE
MQGWALAWAAVLMGLAGLPHCVAMCSAPCAMAAPGPSRQWAFQVGRVAGYAAAGAVAAASAGVLREGVAMSAVLRPLWTLLHLAALAFALWLLWFGRWPVLVRGVRAAAPAAGGWQVLHGPLGALGSGSAGVAWIAWPCVLSQSALLVAALASTPAQGAVVMGAFATASAPALWLGPALRRRLARVRGGGVDAALSVRAAGLLIAGASAWALGHGLWERVAAWCGV